mgnify:CR=1 FL=1
MCSASIFIYCTLCNSLNLADSFLIGIALNISPAGNVGAKYQEIEIRWFCCNWLYIGDAFCARNVELDPWERPRRLKITDSYQPNTIIRSAQNHFTSTGPYLPQPHVPTKIPRSRFLRTQNHHSPSFVNLIYLDLSFLLPLIISEILWEIIRFLHICCSQTYFHLN